MPIINRRHGQREYGPPFDRLRVPNGLPVTGGGHMAVELVEAPAMKDDRVFEAMDVERINE
jgi:hypothetical protein